MQERFKVYLERNVQRREILSNLFETESGLIGIKLQKGKNKANKKAKKMLQFVSMISTKAKKEVLELYF